MCVRANCNVESASHDSTEGRRRQSEREETRMNVQKRKRMTDENEQGEKRGQRDSHHCGLLRSLGMGRYNHRVAGLLLLNDAGHARRNRKPRLIKRRRAIVNDPPRLVVKDHG